MSRRRRRPVLKTPDELASMREAGRVVAEVLTHLRDLVAPGVTTGELDRAARVRIAELGGERPSFLGYTEAGRVFPAAICVSIDDEVVHGIPGGVVHRGVPVRDRALEAGQVVSIDCGVVHGGFHGDAAITLPVGEVAPERAKLLASCRAALWAGIAALRPGARLRDVSAAIEGAVGATPARYGIIRDYVGHGIGRTLHEPPQVPNQVTPTLLRDDFVLEPGLVVALEPILCLGTHRTRTRPDGWTVVTRDGEPAAHFEHTVAVTEDGYEVLTLCADGSATH